MIEIRRGRQSRVDVEIGTPRSLTLDDLELLQEKRTSPVVRRFRDPHHRLARMVAIGLRSNVILEQTGYSRARYDTLMVDPTFKNLVATYREQVTEHFVETADPFVEIATKNMIRAERMIEEQLEEAEQEGSDPIPIRTLLAISRDGADRLGYGKKTTNVNVNVDFAANLEKAIQRTSQVMQPKTLALTAHIAPPDNVAPSVNEGSSVRLERGPENRVKVAGSNPAPRPHFTTAEPVRRRA